MGVPAVDRTAGCRPAHAARDAEHGADQHRLVARLGGIDEGLGPPRVEEAVVIAEAPLLCVQVADSVVVRRALRQVRIEPTSLRRLHVTPPRRGRAGAVEQAGCGCQLDGRRKSEVGILAQVGGEPVTGLARKRALPRCQRAQRRRGPGWKRRRHPRQGEKNGDRSQPRHGSRSFASIFSFGNIAPQPRCGSGRRPRLLQCRVRGCSSMVEPQPSKLITRVRFPPPASLSANHSWPNGPSSGLLSLSVRIASEAPRWTRPPRAGARSALPELQDGDANQHPELDAHRQRDQQTPVGASLELRLADRGEEGVHRCGTSLSLLGPGNRSTKRGIRVLARAWTLLARPGRRKPFGPLPDSLVAESRPHCFYTNPPTNPTMRYTP